MPVRERRSVQMLCAVRGSRLLERSSGDAMPRDRRGAEVTRPAPFLAAITIPFVLLALAQSDPPSAPKRRAVQAGDRYTPPSTSSIAPDPTAPILLFVPTDMDTVTIAKMPYARPQWEF